MKFYSIRKESSGTRQIDLVGIIGSSGVVSEVVNGKQAISKAQALRIERLL